MASSWQLEVKMKANKSFSKQERESNSYREIWPFGSLHTPRFRLDMGVWVWTHISHWYPKNYVRHRCFRACGLCS
jgi:hypothetical protein